ncbi:MAG: CoA transferase, partial [Sneathiella sp.]
SAYSVVYNRGKESVVLDLKNKTDLENFYRLVAEADIFMESSRPGIAKKISIDFETLTAKNEKLIYLSVSGFGQTGPYASRPCTDGVAQAFSGLVDGNIGLDDLPHKFDLPIVDITTGLYAFQSISMALFQRQRDNQAHYLDVSLVTSALEIQKAKLFEQHVEGKSVAKLNVPSGIYECKTGTLAIALATEEHYNRLTKAIGADDLSTDPRFETFGTRAENAVVLRARITEALSVESSNYWEEHLAAAGIIVNKINAIQDVLADEKVMLGGLLRSTEQTGVGRIVVPVLPLMDGNEGDAPELGHSTDAILAEMNG